MIFNLKKKLANQLSLLFYSPLSFGIQIEYTINRKSPNQEPCNLLVQQRALKIFMLRKSSSNKRRELLNLFSLTWV